MITKYEIKKVENGFVVSLIEEKEEEGGVQDIKEEENVFHTFDDVMEYLKAHEGGNK